MVDGERQFPDKVGEGEWEDRGSRFVAWVFFAPNEAAFELELERVRQLHPKARHHCWAWRIEGEYRFNDDGEPGGTAGRPMLQVLEGKQMENSGAICVRYFGGVKLGTGGLVRAYGGATARAADAAGVRFERLIHTGELRLPFAQLGLRSEVQALFSESTFAGDFDSAGWAGELSVPADRMPALAAFLAERGVAWESNRVTRE